MDYGLLEYLRRDAEFLLESPAWIDEGTTGPDSSIEIHDGGYLLETGAGTEHETELRLPAFLDLSRERCDVVAVEVDVQSVTRTDGQYTLGLRGDDGETRMEWQGGYPEALVVADGDATVAEAPARELRNYNRHVHRLEFDRRQGMLRHYVDGARSAEISEESVLPESGTFRGVFTVSGVEDDPTTTMVRRVSHVSGQRRGPE
jgi:hypothetical protein